MEQEGLNSRVLASAIEFHRSLDTRESIFVQLGDNLGLVKRANLGDGLLQTSPTEYPSGTSELMALISPPYFFKKACTISWLPEVVCCGYQPLGTMMPSADVAPPMAFKKACALVRSGCRHDCLGVVMLLLNAVANAVKS